MNGMRKYLKISAIFIIFELFISGIATYAEAGICIRVSNRYQRARTASYFVRYQPSYPRYYQYRRRQDPSYDQGFLNARRLYNPQPYAGEVKNSYELERKPILRFEDGR